MRTKATFGTPDDRPRTLAVTPSMVDGTVPEERMRRRSLDPGREAARDARREARRVAKNGVWRSAKLLATSAVAQTGHIVCLETRADVSSIVAVAPTS